MVIQPCSDPINRSGSRQRFSRFAARILLYTLPALFLIILHTGCSSRTIVIDPDYSGIYKQDSYLYVDSLRIIRVYDNRNMPDQYIGSIRRKIPPKKIEYELAQPLYQYVKDHLNWIIQKSGKPEYYLPVIAYIDTLKVWEKRRFDSDCVYSKCKLRFIYATTMDSVSIIPVTSEGFSQGRIGAKSIDEALKNVLIRCSEDFLKKLRNSNNCMYIRNPEYIKHNDNENPVSNQPETTLTGPPPRTLLGEVNNVDKIRLVRFGANLYKGENIRYGIETGLKYMYHKSLSKNESGMGFLIRYYDIENKNAGLEGYFWAFGSPFYYHIYPNNYNVLYLGVGFSLNFGFETYQKYGSNNDSYFFFGPVFEEYIGFDIYKILFIECGLYQLMFFNSRLLPSDVGARLSLSFGIP